MMNRKTIQTALIQPDWSRFRNRSLMIIHSMIR